MRRFFCSSDSETLSETSLVRFETDQMQPGRLAFLTSMAYCWHPPTKGVAGGAADLY